MAYLVLETGQVFPGERFGAPLEAMGEAVFTTAMTGYLETLTDPSYFGQIVVQTFPLIGNYGVIPGDFESPAPRLTAYVVRQWCRGPSNFRSEGDLDAFLKQRGIPGLCGVDTRALTRAVRERGVMNAVLTDDPHPDLAALAAYRVRGAVAAVTCSEERQYGQGSGPRVALWDFGAKANICRELVRRGCRVTVLPAHTGAARIRELAPDGLVLSNGPGDPAENTDIVEQVRLALESGVPAFGICLGHQLMALAMGAKTHKLKYGHRGANQPVRELATGRLYITSQNHGYAVTGDALPANVQPAFVNANDGTCEGLSYRDLPAFSVQFHPEAAAGPLDTGFLFDRFMALMEGADLHAIG